MLMLWNGLQEEHRGWREGIIRWKRKLQTKFLTCIDGVLTADDSDNPLTNIVTNRYF